MKKYGYWKAIPLSFYSQELYRDVYNNWHFKTLIYLLLIVTLSWIPILYVFQIDVNEKVPSFIDHIIPQLPVLSFKKGELSTPLNKPYFIKSKDNSTNLAIIDTSGKYTNLTKSSVDFLLTKNSFISRSFDGEVKIRIIPTSINATIHPQELGTLITQWSKWLWLMLLPFLLFISWAYRIITAFLYAIVGKIYTKATRNKLLFGDIVRLSMVTLTPALILNTIVNLTIGMFHYEGLIYFGITLYYLIFAIKANR